MTAMRLCVCVCVFVACKSFLLFFKLSLCFNMLTQLPEKNAFIIYVCAWAPWDPGVLVGEFGRLRYVCICVCVVCVFACILFLCGFILFLRLQLAF